MDPFSPKAFAVASFAAGLLGRRAHRKKTLTPDGVVAAVVVGFLLVVTGLRGMNLFVFYQLGSMATKYRHDEKARKDASAEAETARKAVQVLAVSILATALSIFHAIYYGSEKEIDFDKFPSASRISCSIVAHHATSLADTWASELGMLSKSTPVLITRPWRLVPSGTNGGVTGVGMVWSVLGGAAIGLATIAFDLLSGLTIDSRWILMGAICGLVGSIVDSLLGATVQVTYWDDTTKQVVDRRRNNAKHVSGRNLLTNAQVNFVSVAITTFLAGWLIGPLVFS